MQENTHPVLPEYYNHITLDKSASMELYVRYGASRKYTNRAMALYFLQKCILSLELIGVTPTHRLHQGPCHSVEQGGDFIIFNIHSVNEAAKSFYAAADREKDLEPVVNVIVSVSHELCRCLRLSQPQLLCFSPPPLPGRQSDGFKLVRNLKHSRAG